jgi:hypothetical protein
MALSARTGNTLPCLVRSQDRRSSNNPKITLRFSLQYGIPSNIQPNENKDDDGKHQESGVVSRYEPNVCAVESKDNKEHSKNTKHAPSDCKRVFNPSPYSPFHPCEPHGALRFTNGSAKTPDIDKGSKARFASSSKRDFHTG